ncbi:low temperature requirement protein A [Paenibacillus soyae]|uniref:Low temperature requirement protein A n=1 Tax=Paenibacillus soyae TaxID=2969249 RepID=A0A9X2S7D2_9BACL|nr:low temperature requirement protein A [Paenibacillus soyae]MCR2802925.1 low temperature requirement protein A [Paenibacillus soyae]
MDKQASVKLPIAAFAEKRVTWLELFYDLLFVAAVAKASHVLLHMEDGVIPFEYLGKFVLIFVPIWWAWVGQSLFNNRFGQDLLSHRLFMIMQLFFVLIMTASLNVDFDRYYMPFLIGYTGLRAVTAIQYLSVRGNGDSSHHQAAARFLGRCFWIGLAISASSLFFDGWVRYVVLYAGIAVDILIPIAGRKYLVKSPIQTHHLLERFSLFTLIFLGESVVSALAILESIEWSWSSIGYASVSFFLIIAIWWHYFENVEKRVNKHKETAGQTIIYGHFFIYFSLCMLAASIQLLLLEQFDYRFMIGFVFGSAALYFLSTAIVFHRYRQSHQVWRNDHFASLAALLALFAAFDTFVEVPGYVILLEMFLFFAAYAFLSSRSSQAVTETKSTVA